jgi:hypothetical protein
MVALPKSIKMYVFMHYLPPPQKTHTHTQQQLFSVPELCILVHQPLSHTHTHTTTCSICKLKLASNNGVQ